MVDEKALERAYETLGRPDHAGDRLTVRAAITAYLHAVGKADVTSPGSTGEAEGLKLGSRLTVEGVEAVVVPVEPSEAMIGAALNAGLDIYWSYEADERGGGPEDVYRALLSAAGERG